MYIAELHICKLIIESLMSIELASVSTPESYLQMEGWYYYYILPCIDWLQVEKRTNFNS